ncbi:MAG: LacI family DNA-binding transcriptional regulator [Lachnospiraceae bacterium]|nr:LacI family DNA-binding transcriptional regulator [Lachnospiraceae bacterium]
MSRITIAEIARHAGVSRGTVDRALHNRGEINPEVRERVIRSAKILGYPLKAAPNQRKIGILLPGGSWFDRYLKETWKQGVADASALLESLGYRILLQECETSESGEMAAQILAMEEQGVSGLILTARDEPQIRSLVNSLADRNIPTITYNSDISSRRSAYVGQDPYKSGRVAGDIYVKYAEPDRRVLVIAGNLAFTGHRRRVQGFLDKCVERGIDRTQIRIEESNNEYELTREKVLAAFREDARISAVYMANESISGCVDALRELELTERVLVIGNDLTAGTRSMLMEGSVNFIVEQNIYWQGYRPLILMKHLLESPDASTEEDRFTHIRVANRETVR